MTDKTFISHVKLDELLSGYALTPETYTAQAERLARRLDKADTLLELSDPMDWHGPVNHKSSFVNQFDAEVDSIVKLDRETEAELARRIDFSRLLVNFARERADLPPLGEDEANQVTAKLPAEVARRENELQTLRKEMVERNLYLVMLNVTRYAKNQTNRNDLIQEGCASLFRAVDGYDWTRGLLFRTYAVHWLNQAFRNHLYNFGRTVRVPVYLQKALKHIHLAQMRLGDPMATTAEIAKLAELNENTVASALSASNRSFSIDSPYSEGGDNNRLSDMLVSDDLDPYFAELEDVSLEDGLAKEMEKLNDRERKVLRMRFGLGKEQEHTLSEVAGELNVSVERVRQIQNRAVLKMNTPTLRRELEPYLN
ncbi:MAG: RNA polymerase sigma factor (sigma-70 family) [Planctomycetota bacterium]|jgi:RNA polymerase sigma factor (sigma-70 family)